MSRDLIPRQPRKMKQPSKDRLRRLLRESAERQALLTADLERERASRQPLWDRMLGKPWEPVLAPIASLHARDEIIRSLHEEMAGLEAQILAERNDNLAATEKALQRAMLELPAGAELTLSIQRGACVVFCVVSDMDAGGLCPIGEEGIAGAIEMGVRKALESLPLMKEEDSIP